MRYGIKASGDFISKRDLSNHHPEKLFPARITPYCLAR